MNEPEWLTEQLVTSLHGELLAEHGGATGLRDEGLLASALARPRKKHNYENPSLIELAAAYAYGICSNHPFVDGNKRVALAAVDVFLILNGRELVAPEAEAVVMIRDLAAGEIGEAEIADWISANSADFSE